MVSPILLVIHQVNPYFLRRAIVPCFSRLPIVKLAMKYLSPPMKLISADSLKSLAMVQIPPICCLPLFDPQPAHLIRFTQGLVHMGLSHLEVFACRG